MAGGGQNIGEMLNQQNPMGQFNTQSGYNNFASPNQNFMQYPQQGQPNQPTQQQDFMPVLASQTPPVVNTGGPNAGGDYPSTNMGFDGSGSDSGVGGQPVTQPQTPLQQGNKPIGLNQYRPQQGFQIQGNPTASYVQNPQQR
jgi:hypothetical protein